MGKRNVQYTRELPPCNNYFRPNCAVAPSVGQIGLESCGKGQPPSEIAMVLAEAFEPTTEQSTTNGQQVGGSLKAPEHARLLEPLADHRLAAGFHHPGADEKAGLHWLEAGLAVNATDTYRGYTTTHWLADMAATGGPRVEVLRALVNHRASLDAGSASCYISDLAGPARVSADR